MLYNICHMIYDIWYMIDERWYVIYERWDMKDDIQYMVCIIWYLMYGIRSMRYDMWYMIYDIWYMIYYMWYIYIYIHMMYDIWHTHTHRQTDGRTDRQTWGRSHYHHDRHASSPAFPVSLAFPAFLVPGRSTCPSACPWRRPTLCPPRRFATSARCDPLGPICWCRGGKTSGFSWGKLWENHGKVSCACRFWDIFLVT